MGTKDFNLVDKMIAGWRLSKVLGLIKKNDKVLDLGCGSQGYFLNFIKNKIKIGYGLDYDVENRTEGNLIFIKLILKNKLPKEVKSVDKIVMLAVLEHLEIDSVGNLMNQFKNILNKKGQIILTTPTPMSKPLLEILAKLNIINRQEIADHKKYYDKKSMIKIAVENGFKLVSYKLFQMGLNSVVVFEKN